MARKTPRKEVRTGARALTKRRWDADNTLACPRCGSSMARASRVCASCRRAERGTRRYERRVQIQQLWNDVGFTAEQIAAHLGAPHGTIAQEIQAMRRDGWRVDRRHRSGRIDTSVSNSVD